VDSSWYKPLSLIPSLGSQHTGAGSLAGLHEARKETLSQFFTPSDIVSFIWRTLTPSMDAALRRKDKGARIALLDNSVGSGRMLQFANPDKHTLAGFDVHEPSVEAVSAAAKAAGFRCDFIVAGMEEAQPKGFSVALINPPFSIHLESPNMQGFECCAFGKFGPRTSCSSHVYAVAQALAAADIVAAVIPTTFADTLAADCEFSRRLCYVGHLPVNAFSGEGATVSTSIAIWDSIERSGSLLIEEIGDLAEAAIPNLKLTCRSDYAERPKDLARWGIDLTQPTITTPVTGNSTVRVVHHNRRIALKFSCGLTEAKVLNAVYREKVPVTDHHRNPVGVLFKGQGMLDLQVHLMQPDSVASFEDLVSTIARAGGVPDVDEGIRGYLRRQAKRLARHRVPFSHTIRVEGVQRTASGKVSLIARDTFILNPKKWGGPVIKKGDRINAVRSEAGKWLVNAGGAEWPMTDEEVNRKFHAEAAPEASGSAWVEKFTGRNKAFPAIALQERRRADKMGIPAWLSWGFQLSDLVEISGSPYGSIAAWEMGLGKSRLAAALLLMSSSKHNLHVTEAHLVPEVVAELEMIGLPASLWKVIDSPEALMDLRKINVISYNRLRQPVHSAGNGKFTYAKALRRRVGCVVADEGHCLRNLDSEQTRAAWALSARQKHVFTGTLVANYPRDTLGVMAWVAGSATAAQPYGIRGAMYLERRLAASMSYADRGVDQYRDSFVTLEWVTNEFSDAMQAGAKREVPKIANLPLYRDMLAPLVKRRVVKEPEVAKHVQIPTPVETVINVPWSNRHLGHYLDVAENFAAWYRNAQEKAGKRKSCVNLVALLARIGAIETTCNVPQCEVDGFCYTGGETSKQRFAVEHLSKLVGEGHKVIVYVKRPHLLEVIGRRLDAEGIPSVMMHGGIAIEERTKNLREQFRFGSVQVLLATLGCVQTGLNIPEATRIVYLSRDWSAKTERQANARALRPQQKNVVGIDYIHLPGYIDDYQHQMVSFKADAADSGLDWATPLHEDDEFEHLDTILGRFVTDIAKLRGVNTRELRESLATTAAA